MKVTIEIKDEKQIALINELRGDKPAKEFVRLAVDAGIALADMQRKQMKEAEAKGQLIRFAAAKPEFKTLDVAAITDALKDKDPKNLIKTEVGRLVQDYAAQLKKHAQANGNKLPKQMKVNPRTAIEKIAFQITANAIGQAGKAAAEKKAAAK